MESSDLTLWLQKVLDAGLVHLLHWLASIEYSFRNSASLEYFAAITAAITGVLAARNKKIDIFGVLVLGFVTGVGGGTIRDICLNIEVWWVEQPNFTIAIVISCFLTFFITRIIPLPRKLLDSQTPLPGSLYGHQPGALEYHAGVVNAVMMGVITGVAGGMLRDVFLGTIPNVFRPGIYLYATASAAGAILFVCSDIWDLPYKWSFSIGVILVMRIGSIRWKLTLPEYRHNEKDDEEYRAKLRTAPEASGTVAAELAAPSVAEVRVEPDPESPPPTTK